MAGAWGGRGQDCGLAGGAAGRAVFRAGVVGGEVLWRFGEKGWERDMFGVAGRMVGRD